MTKENKNEIAKLHKAGMTYGEIAEKLGITRDSVIGVLKRLKTKELFDDSHCLVCGKEFEINPQGGKRKYCSDKCRFIAWKKKHKGEARKRTKRSFCLNCGKEFLGYSNKHQKFCSRSCAMRYKHEH